MNLAKLKWKTFTLSSDEKDSALRIASGHVLAASSGESEKLRT